MKSLFSAIVFLLIQTSLYSQNGFTMNDNGDFSQNGKKIGQVVRTTKANVLNGTMAEFTVYDVNGVPRFLFEKVEGKFIFLDDNKSFLPRKVDAYPKQVAEFFAADSILTPGGYNVAYRSMFIKKHKGYNFSEKSERDFNAPIRYIEKKILQGETLIGSYEYRVMDNKDVLVAVSDLNNKKVAFIAIDNHVSGNLAGQVDMLILDAKEDTVKVFEKEFDTGNLYKQGIAWIVQNGYLGSKSAEVKAPVIQATQNAQPTVRKDPTPEITEGLRRAASQNDTEAQFKLYKNFYVPDQEKIMWLKKAAENGHAESQYELGKAYEYGVAVSGIAKNLEESLNWYRKSAEQGFAEAQWELGIFYQIGRSVLKEDCDESLKWLLKSVNLSESIYHQFKMAEMYENGIMYERCVKKDKKEAIVWYKKVVSNKGAKNSSYAELARKKLDKWKVAY